MNQLCEISQHRASWIPAAHSHALAQIESPHDRNCNRDRNRNRNATTLQDARALMNLLDAYSGIGGVISGDVLVALLRGCVEQPISVVARWITQREILSFQWGSQHLLPVFQFDMASLRVRAGVPSVMAELRDAFDDMELAEWFARPNSWLQGGTPARRFEDDLSGVLQAARADRFIALGT